MAMASAAAFFAPDTDASAASFFAPDTDASTASFFAPDSDASAADGTTTTHRHPSSVLLDRKAYFANYENATTAHGKTSTGHTIIITFFLADPPAISYFCIHSPELEETDYAMEPLVVCSERDLVLLHFSFNFGNRATLFEPGLREYFIYRAGGENPSFERIPYPGPDIMIRPRILRPSSLGLVLRGDGEFLVVSLAVRMSILDYDLHIFSSETKQWTTRRVPVQTKHLREEDVPLEINKVITLGGGVLGWVDLWRGILVCDVLQPDSVVRVIPLPKPKLPKFDTSHYDSPKQIRDVTFDNGLIKFVEMEHLRKVLVHNKDQMKMLNNDRRAGIIYSSDLLLEEDKPSFFPDGWRLRSYYRDTSCDYWSMGCIVHSDDISLPNPRHSMLLPELRCHSTGKSTLRNLISCFPSLSIRGDDVVYLMSKVKVEDPEAWMIGVHLRKKTLEVLEPFSGVRALLFEPDFCPYAFSKHLNKTPACLQITTANYSENDPNNATVRGCQSVPYWQHPRSLPEEIIYRAPTYVLNDHLSCASTTINNMQHQQNFKWDVPSYCGSSNGYANATHQSYGNYQHPPPLQEQSMWRGDWVVPQPVHPILTSSASGACTQ